MKKIFALILAVMMIATMSVTAFAAETVTTDGDKVDITVNGTYTPSTGAGEKISVLVEWDAMTFTYTEGSAGTWNPETHSYDGTTNGGWSTDTATITVTNHSNVAVTATLAWAKNTALTGNITGTFTETSGTADDKVLELASAAEGESLNNVDKAPTASAEFGISGDAITANATLGTITVTIAKAN